MKYYAGLDIGGSNGRIKVQSAEGTVLGEFQANGCSINTDGYEKSRQRYRELVLPVLDKLVLSPEDCEGICVAASGVDSPDILDNCREIFKDMGFHGQNIRILNDCEVFLHLTEEPALVLVSGTGSICYGRDMNHTVYRTGGWNHIISDEGSGFELGLELVRASADELDGRNKTQCLASMITDACHAHTLEKLNTFINENLFEKSRIAALAEVGYRAACEGDAVALHIHNKCGDRLFRLIQDTLNKMEIDRETEMKLWLWGSILVKNAIVRKRLIQKVREHAPFLDPGVPVMNALDAALGIAATARH